MQVAIPTTMQTVLETIERETGLVGTVLLGGPEPQQGGKLVVMK